MAGAVALVAVLAVGLALGRSLATSTAPTPAPGTALAALATLDVGAEDPFDGYVRESFAWREDVDRNGCDTRNDVLRRDLTELDIREGTNDCKVDSGVLLTDPYTGTRIDFVIGTGPSSDGGIQIDHVVALANAWVTGAQGWSEDTMVQFGNDPLNLLAVDGPANQAKGSGDASEWLPPNAAFRCAYVARQIAVKDGYDLRVTPAEHDAMAEVLASCPDEPLPTRAATQTPRGLP